MIFVLVAVLLATGASRFVIGSRRLITELRPVSGFDAISLSSGELTLRQGESEALTIEAEDNLLPYLTSDVRNGTLILQFVPNWPGIICPTRPIRYKLTVKNLAALNLSGAGRIQHAQLPLHHLAVTVDGVGQSKIDRLVARDLAFDFGGSQDADLAGQVDSPLIVIGDPSDPQAGDLASQTAQVTLGGTCAALRWVQESLAINISGSGVVSYY
jgi:hypothetical protein